ncbi:hypothetical protein OROGR_021327 [Orobanche gracilis]
MCYRRLYRSLDLVKTGRVYYVALEGGSSEIFVKSVFQLLSQANSGGIIIFRCFETVKTCHNQGIDILK